MSDWDSVTVLRKRQPKASAMKTETAINQVLLINNIFAPVNLHTTYFDILIYSPK